MTEKLRKKKKICLLVHKKDKALIKVLLRKARLENNVEWIKVYAELLYTGKLLVEIEDDSVNSEARNTFVAMQKVKAVTNKILSGRIAKEEAEDIRPDYMEKDEFWTQMNNIEEKLMKKDGFGQSLETVYTGMDLLEEDSEVIRISEKARMELISQYEEGADLIKEVPQELDEQLFGLSTDRECKYTPLVAKWLRKLKIAFTHKKALSYLNEVKEAIKKAFFELTIWVRKVQRVAAVSGGKDSVVMVLKEMERGTKFDKLMFSDTGLEFPEMYEYLDRVEKRVGQKIERVRGLVTWDDWFYGTFTKGKNQGRVRGFPPVVGLGCWAKRELKIKPMKKIEGKENIIYLGIAADEEERIYREEYRKNNIYRFPLVEMGLTEQDCLDYLKEQDLENPLYELFGRLGCYLCPKQPLKSLKTLYNNYPDLWTKLKQYEKDSPGGFRIDYTIDELEFKFNEYKPMQLAFF